MAEPAAIAEPFDRATGIGGSDLAAILGISPWRGPLDVWLEKTRDPLWTPPADNQRMRLGRLLESALARAYEEDHPQTRIYSLDAPVWHANGVLYGHVDGFVESTAPVTEDTVRPGVWEAKVAYSDRDWRPLPDYYEVQARAYIAVTGLSRCHVTVLFRQSAEIRHLEVVADPEYDEALAKVAADWWQHHVVEGQPPRIDGTDAATRYVRSRYPRETHEELLPAPPVADGMVAALLALRARMARDGEEEAALVNRLKMVIGEYPGMESEAWRITWKRAQPHEVTDWQLVASAYRQLVLDNNLLTDDEAAAIVGLHSGLTAGARPFLLREKGGRP